MSLHTPEIHVVQDTKGQQIANEDDAACLHAMQYVGAALSTMSLNTALELDIFGIIGRAGPDAQLSASEIASHFPRTHDNTSAVLDRMLRLLATHSFLTCSPSNNNNEMLFGLAPATKFLSLNPKEGTLAYLIALVNHKCNVDVWVHMKDALLDGGDQFKNRNGVSVFEMMQSDPAFNTVYSNSMEGIGPIVMAKILQVYKGFEGLTSVVDVAGGNGQIVGLVSDKYGSLKGINFDLPHVIEAAPARPGVEHVAGDMFESIPNADAVILKDVLHNWSDEHCVRILKNCYRATPRDGKVIALTMIPPEVPDSSPASRYLATIDYVMALKYSGRERTENELRVLSQASGFTRCQVAFLAYGTWSVVEFLK